MTRNVTVRSLPKVALHDHLDGGLRVRTVLELAADARYGELPSEDPVELSEWFHQDGSGSLERYLEAFAHTAAVTQTAEAIERVAYEAAIDLAHDGVVYAEVRFAPALHIVGGLSLEEVIEAALNGLSRGRGDSAIVTGLIPSALRQHRDSEQVAKAAARFAGEGVVGFDLAGPEAGYPPDDHLPAFHVVSEAGLGITIHAGEGDGAHSIYRAVAHCGARRIGHGVRIVDDTDWSGRDIEAIGPLARRIRDHRIHLEVSVRSNVDTGLAPDARSHPLGALYRAGFSVSINTDNRLMSDVSMSDEYASALTDQGLTVTDLGLIAEEALRNAFGDWTERWRIISDVVRPAYAAAAAVASPPGSG